MRVGIAAPVGELPDGLGPDRDLPRVGDVGDDLRNDVDAIMTETLDESVLNRRVFIGDMRNDENLPVAQFHLSCLKFHNAAVDALETQDDRFTDFATAQSLTRLHYQWLIDRVYLPTICDPAVVDRVR